jgi:FkbH-like protein
MTKQICIATTFTAEPLRDSISYWMDQWQFDVEIKFAPYGQVIESILAPQGLLASNHDGVNIILVRPIDLLRHCPFNIEKDSSQAHQWLRAQVEELLNAVATPQDVPCFLYTALPFEKKTPEVVQFVHGVEEIIRNKSENLPGIYSFSLAQVEAHYQVSTVLDTYANQLAHIPYTPEYFAALGTMIARHLNAAWRRPYKVIVLDCDGTLYEGVCAEDGALGVRVTEPYRALQQFMIQQHEQGLLICLCSKNIESDVLAVLDHHPHMLLRQKHLTAYRINWEPKAENIQELAEELQVGLDSFIFIDDNPVECAMVQARLPQVLTLQLPKNFQDIPLFLKQCWAFDRITVTDEDRMRTQLYQNNRSRQAFRQQTISEDEFLEKLQLSVTIEQLQRDQIERAAQLTQRTNQFNVSNIRYSAQEIWHTLNSGESEWWAVMVSDRFGTYGFVGLMAAYCDGMTMYVTTFLLSCRVLNKRVEDAMLAKLGDIAEARSCTYVQFLLEPTPRNVPAQKFLDGLKKGHSLHWTVEYGVFIPCHLCKMS